MSDNKKWEAESDARALIEAEEIKNDSKRYERAKKELKRQAKAAADAAIENKVGKKLGETYGS